MASEASRVNQEFYEQIPPGRRDYWRKMAACRHRVETLLIELAHDRPASVIDLGCGDGALLEEVARVLPESSLAGVDLSMPQIELNRRAHPDVRWHVCDLDREFAIPERAAAANALIASEVIEHLDHPEQFLRSALALGATGCRLYLSTQSGPLRETERRVGHRRHFTAGELAELMLETGWTPLRVWNTGFPFHDLSKWYANLNPDRSLAQFGDQAYGPRQNAICWALRQAFRFNSTSRGAQLFCVATR
jgi:2-polyprenyl-3-methyl-5-hydroxy-6-metoxy-1,4-benzoquinol methylase